MTSKIHLLALCASLPLFAEDVSWIAPGAGSWNGAGNWDSGVVPCVIDRAVFSSTNGLVTLNSSSTVEGLDLMFGGLLPMFINQRQTLTITGPITGTGGLDLQGYTAGSSGDMGTIRLYSTESSFEGGIRCGGGTFRFVSAAGGAIPSGSSLGTGDILLDGGMFSTIFPEVASTSSGYPQSPALPGLTNRVRVSERGGRFHFNVGSGGNNAGMMLGDIELGGPIELQSQGGGNSHGYSLMGTLTLLQDQERTLRFQNGTSHNGDDHLAGPILDGEGEAGNPLHLGVTVRPLYISSMQATYAGGTVIETCGASAVTVRPRTQLGTGDISIRSGGALVLQNPTPLGVDGNLAASARVRVEQGGILECGLNGF